ncbi:hypothetical protein PHYBOEH_006144 [Phytophthora boehmeriae]|uniref:HECT E3 ubiquitin ligase n=1 Tax=Phytophthora boehmeriae TaxID=109152 RepID=A0A8T1WGN7_9STRA|nr:hypothetical protein PHYBOEH_006144 [Phytophthora boehmeriae]
MEAFLNASSASTDGANNTIMEIPSGYRRQSIEFYLYVLLGVVTALASGSMLLYCAHQRRVQRYVEDDNANNNMQRHLLEDSFIQHGQTEWQCSVCYHENHPAKRECLMCGTPEVISTGVTASLVAERKLLDRAFLLDESAESQAALAARNRSFHARRLNEMNLNQRQRGARRRHLWQRAKTANGQFRWARVGHCQPSRISQLTSNIRASLPTAAASLLPSPDGNETRQSAPAAYVFNSDAESLGATTITRTSNSSGGELGVETELTMVASADEDGTFSPAIRKNVLGLRRSDGCEVSSQSAAIPDDSFIAQPSVGYVRHVNEEGQVEWVPADTLVHESEAVTAIDVEEFPRATNYIDFEAVAALPFRAKVRWFLRELSKVAVPWDEGHLLLKIRRDAVLSESMHLLMLVPAADLRQRLRIEFIDEPGLDAGGLMQLHRHALWLRDNEGADALALDFTAQRQTSDGAVITEELKPGGKDIPVTDANKEEYLMLLLKHKMFGGVREQLEALLQGLYDVLPRTLLTVFDYQELELLLCGVPSIDVADWESHTDVRLLRADQGFNKPSSSERNVVQWFWDTIRAFSQEERARLLQFVTGTSRVPAEGFRALLSHDGRVRRFGLQLVPLGTPPAGLYPKAHTCFNRIDVPLYRSRQELVTYLTLVINMEITGFTML